MDRAADRLAALSSSDYFESNCSTTGSVSLSTYPLEARGRSA